MRSDVQGLVAALAGDGLNAAATGSDSSADATSSIEPPAYVAESQIETKLDSGEDVESTIESSISLSGITSDAIVPEMITGISNSIALTLGVASDQVSILGILPGEIVLSSGGASEETTDTTVTNTPPSVTALGIGSDDLSSLAGAAGADDGSDSTVDVGGTAAETAASGTVSLEQSGTKDTPSTTEQGGNTESENTAGTPTPNT
jgi:hypothetical protein